MKICRARPQLVFTFDNRFGSTGWAVPQSVRYITFRLQASYLSATSHTGRKPCRFKSLFHETFLYRPMYRSVFRIRIETYLCGSGSNFIPQCGSRSGSRDLNQYEPMRIGFRILVRLCRHKLNFDMIYIIYSVKG